MVKRISILGTGWLGYPLGKKLVESGFTVMGSVRTELKFGSLKQVGIQPYKIELKPKDSIVNDFSFFETDLLIVSVPPGRNNHNEKQFLGIIKQLIRYSEYSPVKYVLFFSSTSVYPQKGQTVTEKDAHDPDKASGKSLLKAELLLTNNESFKTTVLRFGGLIGAERNPARFLARKSQPISGNTPMNLIHQEDCISIIEKIIEENIWGEIFNACSPVHPTRKEFYTRAAEVSELQIPEFHEQKTAYKVADCTKLIEKLDYKFIYPSPIDYINSMIYE